MAITVHFNPKPCLTIHHVLLQYCSSLVKLRRAKTVILLAATLLCSTGLVAQSADTVDAFNEAYRSYQAAAEGGRWGEAATGARDALRLGRQVQGEENQTVAALAYNYALALLNAGQNEQATSAIDEVVSVFDTVFGEQSEAHISVFFDAARNQIALGDDDAAADLFRQSTDLGEQYLGEESPELGQLNLDAGILLLEQASSTEARGFLDDAHDIFEDVLGNANPATAFSAYYLGKFWLADGNYRRAESSLTEALPALEAAGDDMLPALILLHSHLVEVYSQRGRPDDATAHVTAYAQMTHNQEARPIFMPPAEPSRRTGDTQSVDFIVDINVKGFPENIRANGGDNENATEAAMEALETWRFAPPVIDDVVTTVADVAVTVPFARPRGR